MSSFLAFSLPAEFSFKHCLLQQWLSRLSTDQSGSLCYLLWNISVVPRPSASASPGNLLELQTTGLTTDLLKQKIWRCGPAVTRLSKDLRWFQGTLKFGNHHYRRFILYKQQAPSLVSSIQFASVYISPLNSNIVV